MSKYTKGRRLEYKTIRVLEEEGFEWIRSAGSKGVFDIWACRGNVLLLVQVKANKKPSSDEVERIRSFHCPTTAAREVWVWRDRDPNPEVISYGPTLVWHYSEGEAT